MKTLKYLAAFLGLVILAWSCNNDDDNPNPTPQKGALNLHFDLQWNPMNSEDLTLGEKKVTAAGDTVQVNEVRMWVSNVKLYNDGVLKWEDQESYYLVERTSTNEREMIMFNNVPVGTYDQVEFAIGVDSAHNHSLDQKEGELDEGVGMSWNWLTGYKFFVVNGMYYNNDSAAYRLLRIHIGLDDYYSVFKLDLPMDIQVKKGETRLIHMPAPVKNTFDSPNVIQLQPFDGTIMWPQDVGDSTYAAVKANYNTMFHVHHVE